MSFTSKIGEKCHFLLFLEMAHLLFDIFYDEDCINEKVFWKWLHNPDQDNINGHNMVIESTKAFFDWLLLAESGTSDEEDDDDNEETE